MEKGTKKKWLRAVLIGAVFIVIVLTLVRTVFLSDKAVVSFIQKTLSEQTGLEVTIKSGSSRLHRELRLKGITAKDSAGKVLLDIDKIKLQYRPLALAKKELKITSLEIVHPHVTIKSLPTPNADLGQPAKVQLASAVQDSSVKKKIHFTLPVTIIIDELKIIDGELTYQRSMPSSQYSIHLPGVNLSSDNLRFKNSDDLVIRFDLSQNETAELEFQKNGHSLAVEGPIQTTSSGEFRSSNSRATLNVDLNPKLLLTRSDGKKSNYTFPRTSLEVKARLLEMNNVFLDTIRCYFDDHSYIEASGSLLEINQRRTFHAKVIESQIRLEVWRNFMEQVAPLFGWDKAIREFLVNGEIKLLNFEVDGSLEDPKNITAQGRGLIHNLNLRLADKGIKATGLSGEANFSGRWPLKPESPWMLAVTLDTDSVQYEKVEDKLGIITDLVVSANADHSDTNQVITILMDLTAFSSVHDSLLVHLKGKRQNQELDQFLNPEQWSFYASATCDSFDISALTKAKVTGKNTTQAIIELKNQDYTSYLLTGPSSLTINSDGKLFSLNTDGIKFRAKGHFNDAYSGITLASMNLSMPPYLNATGRGSVNFKAGWQIDIQQYTMNVSNVLNTFKSELPEGFKTASLAGSVSGDGEIGIPNKEFGLIFNASLGSQNLVFNQPEWGIRAVSDSVSAEISQVASTLEANGTLHVDSLIVKSLNPAPFRDQSFSWCFSNASDGDSSILKIDTDAATMGLTGNVSINHDNSISVLADISADQPVELREGLFYTGDATLKMQLKPDTAEGMQAAGSFVCSANTLSYGDLLQINSFDLNLSFDTQLQKNEGTDGYESTIPANDPVLYQITAHLNQEPLKAGHFEAKSLIFKDYKLTNLETPIEIGTYALYAPSITGTAYDGTVSSSLYLDFQGLKADSIRYVLSLDAIDINTAQLPRINTKKSEASQLSAFAYFNGVGINPNTHFDLTGNLHLTSIGRQVADNILRFINPGQSDPSIRTFRSYINRGWGVKVFSFDIKDDFVYVSITPAKPPLTQPDMWLLSRFVGLGESITFSRIPVRYFLTSPALIAEDTN